MQTLTHRRCKEYLSLVSKETLSVARLLGGLIGPWLECVYARQGDPLSVKEKGKHQTFTQESVCLTGEQIADLLLLFQPQLDERREPKEVHAWFVVRCVRGVCVCVCPWRAPTRTLLYSSRASQVKAEICITHSNVFGFFFFCSSGNNSPVPLEMRDKWSSHKRLAYKWTTTKE